MFAKSILVTFLALALSVQAVPKNPSNGATTQCAAAKTVTALKTVTVTARGAGATNSKGNQGATEATTTAAAAAATSKGNNAIAKGTKTKAAGAAASSAAAANTGKNTGNAQTSLTLDPRVLASGFAQNGQEIPVAGQVASLTSKNNFINFCLTAPNLPITNGKQITTGSCNPAPIGLIPSVDNMPSSKFVFPPNFGTIKAGTSFTVKMAIANMQTGAFVNAQANYFAAPQQLNGAGQIIGHSHVVIEQLSSLTQTTPTDPKKFAFFKGLNAAAIGGQLTADVTAGLSPGVYRLSSINTSSNHQPAIVPIAQHGGLDDAIYFTVTADGKPAAGAGTAATPAKGAATPAKGAATTAKAATTTAKGATATTKSKTGKRRSLNRLA